MTATLLLSRITAMIAPFSKPGTPLILHVEDNQAQLQSFKSILEGNGFAVLQANNAEEALQLCRDTPVSLVVSDHMLSGEVTGAQLAGQIKALKPTVPVILHSGTPPSTMRHLDGFIHKGEPTSTLIAFIRNLVNRFSE